MEEMGIEPIVTCTPNQHSPTISAPRVVASAAT